MEQIVYAIKNKNNLYATYGKTEFKREIRFARLYKSKKTALQHYFNNTGDYKNLVLEEILIKTLSEQKLDEKEFKENRE
nr:MAG TPA: hypothetical protein [Caudoviricetes sp.]